MMLALLLALAAQDGGAPRTEASIELPAVQGNTAESAVGRVGQRQARDEVAQDLGLNPNGRISSRIENRIQSRLRNRIDQYYDPQANATSPFSVAADQARVAGRRR